MIPCVIWKYLAATRAIQVSLVWWPLPTEKLCFEIIGLCQYPFNRCLVMYLLCKIVRWVLCLRPSVRCWGSAAGRWRLCVSGCNYTQSHIQLLSSSLPDFANIFILLILMQTRRINFYFYRTVILTTIYIHEKWALCELLQNSCLPRSLHFILIII